MESNLTPFEGNGIRKIWHDEQWYFSVVDVIGVLTESEKPSQYWHNMKKRDTHLSPICLKLKLKGLDGKTYPSDCANTEGILRIVMSVPSPKAEPLKLWLAEQGKRTIDETENPELLTQRQIEIYKAKGRTDEWIKNRISSIEARNRLTAEWKERGVTESKDYSSLTATIARGTFGMSPTEHREFKDLPTTTKELRDHMTPLELIFTALGEEMTRQTAIKDDAQGFNENHDAAVKGGKSAGHLRKEAEKKGFKVLSKENFLPPSKDDKTSELPQAPTDTH